MIRVENQYVLTFSADGNEDFIDEENLIRMLIIEEVGNVLPSMECAFDLQDESAILDLAEGKTLSIGFGKDDESMKNMRFHILKSYVTRENEDAFTIVVRGLYDAIPYCTDHITKCFKRGKQAIEVFKEVAGKYFSVISNIEVSRDEQVWVQSNKPDKAMINELWMHMNLPNTFPMLGIAATGEIFFHDVKKHIASYPEGKWRFVSTDPQGGNDVTYGPDYKTRSDSGFVNQWVGYASDKPTWNINNCTYTTPKPSAKPLLANGSSDFNRNTNIGRRMSQYICMTDNTHSEYWNCYDKNIHSLAVFSTMQVELDFAERIIDINPTDIVFYMEKALEEEQASEYYTGLYIVEKVVRQISDKRLRTAVCLCREIVNMQDSG